MISEKKVKLMTRIAINQKNEGKDIKLGATSFKVDYITTNVLYTAVAATIAYVLLVIIYALNNLEVLLIGSSIPQLLELLGSVVGYYIAFLAIFIGIALAYYSVRYDKAFAKTKREYIDYKNLTKLSEK